MPSAGCPRRPVSTATISTRRTERRRLPTPRRETTKAQISRIAPAEPPRHPPKCQLGARLACPSIYRVTAPPADAEPSIAPRHGGLRLSADLDCALEVIDLV